MEILWGRYAQINPKLPKSRDEIFWIEKTLKNSDTQDSIFLLLDLTEMWVLKDYKIVPNMEQTFY